MLLLHEHMHAFLIIPTRTVSLTQLPFGKIVVCVEPSLPGVGKKEDTFFIISRTPRQAMYITGGFFLSVGRTC